MAGEDEPAKARSGGRSVVEQPDLAAGVAAAAAAGGASGSTDSPVCRGPGRRSARISYDDGEPEPSPSCRGRDEFGSDSDDRQEIKRLAAMPVDEFIREIQGEVGGVPAGESNRRTSGEVDESINGGEGEAAVVDVADESITERMMQEMEIPPADESISEIPADTSANARADESIVDRQGRPSRRSAGSWGGRSLNHIDPDLTGPADPPPPNSQDSLAEIVVSSGEVASPRRVAQLDTVLVTPGGRWRAKPGCHSLQTTPKTGRRSGRSLAEIRLATATTAGHAPVGVTESDSTPRVESKMTPRTESKLTPRVESKTPPRAESKSTPQTESKLTPRAEPESTPMAESESESAPRATESDLIPASPPGPPPRRRVSQPPASPSSEDLLVPAGFFNESSLCVPAETSLVEGSERGETTRQRASGQAAAAPAPVPAVAAAPAPAPTADQTDSAGSAGGRRGVLPSAASGQGSTAGGPPAAGEVSETESEDMFCASRPTEATAALTRRRDSPPPSPPRPPPLIVASGLKRAEQDAAQRLATAHGGRFLRQWQPGVTHVIVRTGPRLEAGRTLKFLQGVAARAWLVSPGWVTDCLSTGTLLPEEEYEAIDAATAECGPRRSRLSGGALFTDFVFCCVEPFRDVTLEQLEALIGQSGGAVAASPAALASAPGRVRLVVAQEECEHDFCGWRRRHGVPSVSYEWLIDCVATQRLWSLLDNTLCGATEAELREAGVPQELCLAETQETEYFDSMGL